MAEKETEAEVWFTPGPWEWDGCAQIVEAARPHMRVAFLPSDAQNYACGEPNAHLITAAPDMYNALLGAEEWLRGWASAEPYIDTIRAALDKANPLRREATQASEERPAPASSSTPSVPNAPVPDTQGKD